VVSPAAMHLNPSDAQPRETVGEHASTRDIDATLRRLHGADGPEDVEFTPERRRCQLVDCERLRTSGYLRRPA
jgi:hypothetical protein